MNLFQGSKDYSNPSSFASANVIYLLPNLDHSIKGRRYIIEVLIFGYTYICTTLSVVPEFTDRLVHNSTWPSATLMSNKIVDSLKTTVAMMPNFWLLLEPMIVVMATWCVTSDDKVGNMGLLPDT